MEKLLLPLLLLVLRRRQIGIRGAEKLLVPRGRRRLLFLLLVLLELLEL